MVNLYRILRKHRGHPELRKRDALIREIEGKEYLTEEDLTKIFAFKGLTNKHTNRFIEKYTNKAFESTNLEEKILHLKKINGVGMVSATTILSLQNPYSYAEINHVVWEILKKEFGLEGTGKDHKSDYGIGEYKTYLTLLQAMGEEFGMKITDVEFVLKIMAEEGIE